MAAGIYRKQTKKCPKCGETAGGSDYAWSCDNCHATGGISEPKNQQAEKDFCQCKWEDIDEGWTEEIKYACGCEWREEKQIKWCQDCPKPSEERNANQLIRATKTNLLLKNGKKNLLKSLVGLSQVGAIGL